MRTIPITLQDELDSNATTLSYLLKITATNGVSFGVTSLDVDELYDDGEGEVLYSSVMGLNQSGISTSESLEVSNAEASMLLIETLEFNEQDVQNGLLDFAKYVLYRHDWKNPTNGHYIVSTGTAGKVTTHDSLSGVMELRGISQQLKQTFVQLYSITCRAPFGSVKSTQVRFPCKFDADSLWGNSSVIAVSTENDRVFTATLPAVSGPNGALEYVPGLVNFTSGQNTGAVIEIDKYESNTVYLKFPSQYPIEAGDTFRARPDCAKRFQEDCIDKFDNALNFRGEPRIPVTDEGPAGTPGATYPGFGSGVVPGYTP